MGVTFIIGNGFDLALGLKTRYQDAYAEYIKEKTSSPTIQAFKDSLEKDCERKYKTWSDFEMGMAQYAGTLKSEDKLVECVRDFRRFLTAYLKQQERIFFGALKSQNKAADFQKNFKKGLEDFAKGLAPNAQRAIPFSGSPFHNGLSILTFNYTGTLNFLVKGIASLYNYGSYINPPIHVHGQLDSTVLLGVDNEEQVPISLTNTGKRTFLKRYFAFQHDDAAMIQAMQEIQNSSTICIYGWSMGDSDAFWVNQVGEWLKKDKKHHLVWHPYGVRTFSPYEADAQMDEEDRQKAILLEKLHLSDQYATLEDQLHVVLGKRIFKFPSLELGMKSASTLENSSAG